MARSEITLGFVGSGKVEKRNAYALLRDLIDASGGNAKFIFPMTKTLWNPALSVVSDFAMDNAIPVEAIVDDSTAKVKELKALLGGARRQHQSAAPGHKMATLLDEARDGKLIVLWDDEDEAALEAVKAADEKGVALLELTRGLDRIELVAGEGEDDEPESDEVEDEEGIVGQDENDEDVTGEEDEDAGQDDDDEEIPEEMGDDIDAESAAEEEFEEPAAEDDLDTEAQDDDGDEDDEAEEDDEFPEEEEFSLPEEDESDVAVLDMEADIVEEVRQVTGMSEFQRRLLAVLEKTSDALVSAINTAMTEELGVKPQRPAMESKKAAAASTKPAAARPAKKAAAPAKKATPAKTAPPKKSTPVQKAVEKPAVKRTVPAKKAAAPEANGTGKMSKAAAQKIIDAYRPRRGRPPAEVTEARKILGLA